MQNTTDVSKLIGLCTSTIRTYQDDSGAYPASPNFEKYRYCWFRDGSFIADAMSRAGDIESAEKFFGWCSTLINIRRDHILSGGKIDARYKLDGKESNEPWNNFQIDGFGILLWAISEHGKRHNRSIEQYKDATGLIQHYLATKWYEPSFDCWEENLGIHAASLACVYAGLAAYEHPEAPKVKEVIDLNHEKNDASLLLCPLLGAVSDSEFEPYLKRIEQELIAPDGGVYRYLKDEYYGGGEWPVLTSLLGLYYLKLGRREEALLKLKWITKQMNDRGWLPEQTKDYLQLPNQHFIWLKRWGQSANPLLWSGAMFIILASKIVSVQPVKRRENQPRPLVFSN